MRLLRITLFGVLAVVAAVAIGALIGGTFLFWIWPVAIEPFVEHGVTWLPPVLTWWQAVTLRWVFGILIKSTKTNNNCCWHKIKP